MQPSIPEGVIYHRLMGETIGDVRAGLARSSFLTAETQPFASQTLTKHEIRYYVYSLVKVLERRTMKFPRPNENPRYT